MKDIETLRPVKPLSSREQDTQKNSKLSSRKKKPQQIKTKGSASSILDSKKKKTSYIKNLKQMDIKKQYQKENQSIDNSKSNEDDESLTLAPILVTRGYKHVEGASFKLMDKPKKKKNGGACSKEDSLNSKAVDESQDPEVDIIIKKEKNRLSAQNSRQRKKMYMKMLEDQCRNQEAQIKELQEELQKLQEEKTSVLVREPRVVRDTNCLGWMEDSRKLDTEHIAALRNLKQTRQSEMSSKAISEALFTYKKQFCFNGSYRVNKIGDFFGQIKKYAFPEYLK